MPSKNSYNYYSRFLKCLHRYLEKNIEEQKKDKWIDDPETFFKRIKYDDGSEEGFNINAGGVYAAFKLVFDEIIEKAPSACMGADDWFDKFLISAVSLLCPGKWCGNPHCKQNNNRYPYNCAIGSLPYKCKTWKDWRKMWQSYPEKETCQKCKYYKPEKPYYPHDKDCVARTEKINQYKCYCRSKELPEGCPKKTKEKTKANA
jgi:hypothetical protein